MKVDQNPPIGPQVRIRHYREALSISVAELVIRIAEQGVEVHPDTIRNIELGRRGGSEELMAAWSRALGLSPIDIWQAKRRIKAGAA